MAIDDLDFSDDAATEDRNRAARRDTANREQAAQSAGRLGIALAVGGGVLAPILFYFLYPILDPSPLVAGDPGRPDYWAWVDRFNMRWMLSPVVGVVLGGAIGTAISRSRSR